MEAHVHAKKCEYGNMSIGIIKKLKIIKRKSNFNADVSHPFLMQVTCVTV